MGIVEDVRKAVQDVLTPDIRAMQHDIQHISIRLDGVEIRMDAGFAAIMARLDTYEDAQSLTLRLAEVEKRLSAA